MAVASVVACCSLVIMALMAAAATAGSVPAVYVFGDSLADVGNNNHLLTLLKADFSHNGMDYAGGKATGRFSNGKNSADFLVYVLTVLIRRTAASFDVDANNAATPSQQQQYVAALIQSLSGQLQSLYNLGARKVLFLGTGPVGCTPSLREMSSAKVCNAVGNAMAVQYNKAAEGVLSGMAAKYTDLHYALFDSSAALLRYINQPAEYGFVEAKAACCGLGDMNAKIACTPLSSYCANRSDHVFWDFYHPTEATAQKLTATAFDGSAPFIFPINVRQLSAI
ncbi:unnamed protein product [Triticum turgidum subsp. durum]|uniref:GDSL esterase/lipase n=1 Tax=Triticum turgidum subsp. durum TaxID=4567 RepID=A0A9R0WUW6_TRITD|nr:unnamed protein product [Triticum turgidum subsp. durum]